MKYGGIKVYNTTKPFFLGLILGSFVTYEPICTFEVAKFEKNPDGFPWTLEANKESVYKYHKGTLPHSDELMEKSIIMPVPSVMTKRI